MKGMKAGLLGLIGGMFAGQQKQPIKGMPAHQHKQKRSAAGNRPWPVSEAQYRASAIRVNLRNGLKQWKYQDAEGNVKSLWALNMKNAMRKSGRSKHSLVKIQG